MPASSEHGCGNLKGKLPRASSRTALPAVVSCLDQRVCCSALDLFVRALRSFMVRTNADPTGYHESIPPAGLCGCSSRLRSRCGWAPELTPEAKV